jgi:hypothetical protein
MLIGREREVAHIDALLDAAHRGGSAALLVHGEAGILSQIYRKLDLRGRAQLAGLMAAELPSPAQA